ncbi:MAG: DUF1501 domain-containing protein [Halioglobus sp.]
MLSRRNFLSHSCSLGVASATLGSSLLQLGLARHAAAQSATGYRALVCILLAGGNDSYNMLVPVDDDQHREYSLLRSDLALDQSSLLTLPGTSSAGRRYGVHPGMQGVRELYGSGDLAMVANVGTLLEAFNSSAFDSGSARLPLGLFSHADQINQWQTAKPDARIAQGWAGRMADILQDVNLANGVSMNISLSGTNVYQSGNTISEYSVSPEGDGAVGIESYDDGSEFGDLRKRMVDSLVNARQRHIFRAEYNRRLSESIAAQAVFVGALASSPTLTTTFSGNPLSQSLRQVARIIGARSSLGAARQTFFITLGDWDHHDDVIEKQAVMLPQVSAALQEFRNALVELAVVDDVTTFTSSDFGRTLTSNGKGSDHGWGGHHMVMGGSVEGGQIVGEYPELRANNPLDVGRGVYAPTLSVDEYFAELALWFGVARSDLVEVLPNIGSFNSPQSSSPPVGFLRA